VSSIFVKENFFNDDLYTKIVNEMVRIEYAPPEAEIRKAFDGTFWHVHYLPDNCELQIVIKKLIHEHFNYEISKYVFPSLYTMVGATDKPRPHVDLNKGCTHQCLIYMHGPKSINNGTGFYKDGKLDMHVGFKPNRAIFFTSDVYHTPLQWNGNGSFRYSINNFFT